MMVTATITEVPELRFTASGKSVLTMSIFAPRLGNEPVPAIAWQEKAELIANDDDYFKHGATIKVSGYFKERKWRNADGVEVSRREFNIQEVY